MKRWILAGFVAFCMVPLGMCQYHTHFPVWVDNDTDHSARIQISEYKILDKIEGHLSKPGDGGGTGSCSKAYEFLYFATPSHPDYVAYRMKDICDLGDCSCKLKVSDLEKRRRQLSVPWEKAGNILPPGVSHW